MKKIGLSFGLVVSLLFSLMAQPSIDLVLVTDGLSDPVDITHAGDARLFVVEKPGRIRIIDEQGNLLSTSFLNIVSSVNDFQSEQGLLGLAFHPDYANNGYFFVNYTKGNGDTRISRFSVSADDPNEADPNSELVILEIFQPYWNHNGGDLNFGPDGYLYIGTGDGGSADDPDNRSQDPQDLLGKMLRIDIDNPAAGQNYGIPADNPFVDPNDGILDEIWATGLRNPWRFSFDRVTGDMWIADVGQYFWEEIDFQPADSEGGENYGWRCYEGFEEYITANCDLSDDFEPPIQVYSHDFSVGCSVTGGYIYRGCTYPEMYGYYLYVDYCTGRFWGLTSDGAGGWENYDLINSTNLTYSTFGEDVNGELYVAALSQGEIFRVIETTTEQSLMIDIANESCSGDGDGAISTTWSGADPLQYEWSTGSDMQEIVDLSSGMYSLTVTTVDGCVLTYDIEVENNDPETPVVELNMDQLEIPDNYTSYQWYYNGAIIPDATNYFYDPDLGGDYYVVVTNDFGCSATSAVFNVEIIDGVVQLQGVKSIDILPNPFSDQFQIQILMERKTALNLEVVNAFGQAIWQRQIDQMEFSEELNASDWPVGVYFVRVEHEGAVWVSSIIKQ